MGSQVGNVHTLEEAAQQLRIPKRTVAKVARENGFCTLSGRNLLFNDGDLEAIWNVMRCPPNSKTVEARTSGRSGVHSEDKAFSRLLALATQKAQRR